MSEEPEQPDEPDEAQAHASDGLDLARAIARATAGAGITPAKPKRRPLLNPGETRGAGRRGGPQFSGSHPDGRDPQLLDAAVERIVADRGWAIDLQVHGIFGRWAAIVGPEIADHSTPETFTDGRLSVRTDSTAWATQLTLLSPQLLTRIADELGPGVVVALEVAGPRGPSWKKGPRGIRGARGPRDTYG